MTKLKELFKNKKFLIVFIIIVILIISLVIFLCLFNRETKELKENNYTSYLISENEALLEIEFKESYYECTRMGKVSTCSDVTSEVTNVEVLVDTDVNLDNLDLENTIINFVNALLDNDVEINDLIITSNYEFKDEFVAKLKEKINGDINIYLDYQKNIDDFNTEVNYYTITFDTAGGSSIDSIVVKENDMITKPDNPTKEGYTFLGWYIDDEEFNFEDLVKSDLTLVAKWEENKNSNSGSSSSGGTTTNTDSKINLNNNLSATVYKKSTGSQACFFYIFASNLQELYPDASYSDISNGTTRVSFCPFPKSDCPSSEIALDDLNNSNLAFNTSKESSLENTLKKYDNTPGFTLVSFNNDNHKISFEYEYITFNGLDVADGTTANKEVVNALKGAYLFQGPCGGYDASENITVNEEICEKFNLDCGRW